MTQPEPELEEREYDPTACTYCGDEPASIRLGSNCASLIRFIEPEDAELFDKIWGAIRSAGAVSA